MNKSEESVDQQTIVLSGPFVAQVSSDLQVCVGQISISAKSHIPDVAVKIDWTATLRASPKVHEDQIHDFELYDSEAFIGAVMSRLAEVGYAGPPFGRAELGMQGRNQVTLEPGDEFGEFAIGKGWQYAEGLDEYRANQIAREVNWSSKLEFQSADGTQFSIRLEPLIQEHSRQHQRQFGGLRAEILRDVSLPMFRDSHETAIQWLRDTAEWDRIGRMVEVDDRPLPDSKHALMHDDSPRVSWNPGRKAKP